MGKGSRGGGGGAVRIVGISERHGDLPRAHVSVGRAAGTREGAGTAGDGPGGAAAVAPADRGRVLGRGGIGVRIGKARYLARERLAFVGGNIRTGGIDRPVGDREVYMEIESGEGVQRVRFVLTGTTAVREPQRVRVGPRNDDVVDRCAI